MRHAPRRRIVAELLERRLFLDATAGGTVTGTVDYQYPLAGGGTATVPLVDRVVYDDVAGTGTYVAGDPTAVTDLQGGYTLALTGPGQTVRVLPRPGWSVAAGGSAVASAGDVVAPFDLTMTAPVVIDVVAAYTADAPQSYGPSDAAFTATIAGLFAFANQVQADSDTNVRMNLVTTVETTYTPSGNFETDLALLAAGGPADLTAARHAAGADLTVMFEGDGDLPGGGEVGLSYEMVAGHPNAARGVAIVGLLGNPARDGDTLAHELGHLLGADHDPPHATHLGSAPFAHGVVTQGTDGVVYQDVMAYGTGTVLPFYSTPAAFYAGVPLGRVTNEDNARAVRLDAPAVARYDTTGDEGPSTIGPTPLVAALAVTSRRGSVLGGTAGTATLSLTNAGAVAVAGPATVAVSVEDIAGGPLTPLASVTLPVALRPGQVRATPVKFTWPTGLAAGNYTVVATVSIGGTFAVAGGSGTPLASSAAVAYQVSTVVLTASAASAAMVARSGALATIRVRLGNAGTAPGTASFTADLAPAAGPSDTVSASVAARPRSLPAGSTRVVPLTVALPVGLAKGTYQLTIDVSPTASPADVDATVTAAISIV
jgi:hypothetical protein